MGKRKVASEKKAVSGLQEAFAYDFKRTRLGINQYLDCHPSEAPFLYSLMRSGGIAKAIAEQSAISAGPGSDAKPDKKFSRSFSRFKHLSNRYLHSMLQTFEPTVKFSCELHITRRLVFYAINVDVDSFLPSKFENETLALCRDEYTRLGSRLATLQALPAETGPGGNCLATVFEEGIVGHFHFEALNPSMVSCRTVSPSRSETMPFGVRSGEPDNLLSFENNFDMSLASLFIEKDGVSKNLCKHLDIAQATLEMISKVLPNATALPAEFEAEASHKSDSGASSGAKSGASTVTKGAGKAPKAAAAPRGLGPAVPKGKGTRAVPPPAVAAD
jgi:hypothetical protein